MSAGQRPSRNGAQLWRCQKLVEWVRSGDRLTTVRAAERFEVSSRTIASDIEYLRQIGVPIEYDRPAGTFVLTEPFGNLPLVAIRNTDLAALLVAQHGLRALGDGVHAATLEGVADRLAAMLPETVHVEPDALARSIRFEPGPHAPVDFSLLSDLERAVAESRAVRMDYYSNSRAELTDRTVEPYTLLGYQGKWYLVAYCRLREGMRDFRLDRIRKYRVLNERVDRDPKFDLEAYLGPAFGMFRGDRTYAVHVRFSPYQARWIREEIWHESQILTQHPDGGLDVRFQATGLPDLARWVLSYGGECEVVSPKVLRERVKGEVERMGGVYGLHAEANRK
ncbi:MAG TPA: WYL domain-containing protein [Rhodothermales bacterium]|nr:WYL domain-containing protein [Rhodothermales bacterium]